MRLYNTLSRQEETFAPLDGRQVRMYTCGLTVYARGHIGNFRTFVAVDVLRRTLRHWAGYEMRHVMNFTDVDDRTIVESQKAGVALRDYTARFIAAFLEDAAALGLEPVEETPRATDEPNLRAMCDMVVALDGKGHTYRSEGSVYFKISTLPEYGRLARLDHAGIKPGARIDTDKYEKEDARDFVLWKATRPDEPTWDYGVGPGRPGWHIECSAMARRLLGDTLDIHTGGVDLIFPHHENEIAQSEGATGRPLSRFWFHVEHLILDDGEKMSKSLGNVFTLRDLLERGYRGSTLRYLLLSVHYRKQLRFSWASLDQAEEAMKRLMDFLARVDRVGGGVVHPEIETRLARARDEFGAMLFADVNAPGAVGVMFELIRALNAAIDADLVGAADAAAIRETFARFDLVLGVVALRRAEDARPKVPVEEIAADDRRAPGRPACARLRRRRPHPPGPGRARHRAGGRPRRHAMEAEVVTSSCRNQERGPMPATITAPLIKTALPGPRARAIIERDAQFVSPSYTRAYPLVIARGEGAVVEDVDGNVFLDCAAGIAVNSTGVSHPDVVRAIVDQAQKFLHMSGTDFYYEPQVELARAMAGIVPIDGPVRSFFGNSGAEAVEAAIKLARYHTKRPFLIAFLGSFHGRTMGALSLTASRAVQRKGFGPTTAPGVFHVPYADCYRCPANLRPETCQAECLNFLEEQTLVHLVSPDEVAAIVVEPIQGEGGYLVPPVQFHQRLQALARQHGMLLIVDEVQSGMGRTGKMFACEHFGLRADIVAIAKGVASGLPLGVTAARADVMVWPPGAHASTFGGNPVSCAAALATIRLLRESLIANAATVGAHLMDGVRQLQQRHPMIGDVRGKGLMIGIEFVRSRETKARATTQRDAVVDEAFARGLLVLGAGRNALRLSPPLVLSRDQADTCLRILDEAVGVVERSHGIVG